MSETTTGSDSELNVTDGSAGVEFGETLIEVDGLTRHFTNSGVFTSLKLERGEGRFPRLRYDREIVKAVDDVSFEIKKGETLGLVGESGCGKSTLARTILRLLKPTAGSVIFKGEDLAELSKSALRDRRKDIQMIFQDPQSSLNPRMKVGPIVEAPMKAHGMLTKAKRKERARELLEKVGLDPQHYNRYPHAFSGGQRQRVNLARALSVNPDFIVCDEPTSALDASIQAQVLNTMRELQEEFGLTYLFISHDLSVIRHISDQVAVMYLGHIVELADKEEVFENTQHPYTESLLSSIPVPDPRKSGQHKIIKGDVPSPINPPSGCRFHSRCPKIIAPDSLELTSEEWNNVRTFTRAVERREFEPTDSEAIKQQYFDNAGPDGEIGELVDRAITEVLSDEWQTAHQLLYEQLLEPSVCANEQPFYEVETSYGEETHFVGCHLMNDEDQVY